MHEDIEDWLIGLRLNWYHFCRLTREVRGVTKDRAGTWYWHLEDEWSPGHVAISFIAWPGFSSTSRSAGWTEVARVEHEEAAWMIHDVQVSARYERRGIGTALVRAAIALARRRGARELRGHVTNDDAKSHPFLAQWYARLGFTVQRLQGGDSMTYFWMDLTHSE